MAKCSAVKAKRSPKLDEWEIENAASTLARAGEIKSDKRMMAAVKKHETKRRKSIDKAMKAK